MKQEQERQAEVKQDQVKQGGILSYFQQCTEVTAAEKKQEVVHPPQL